MLWFSLLGVCMFADGDFRCYSLFRKIDCIPIKIAAHRIRRYSKCKTIHIATKLYDFIIVCRSNCLLRLLAIIGRISSECQLRNVTPTHIQAYDGPYEFNQISTVYNNACHFAMFSEWNTKQITKELQTYIFWLAPYLCDSVLLCCYHRLNSNEKVEC